MVKHLGRTLNQYSILECSGRAVSTPFALASSPAKVTCKACLKKLPAVVPNMPAAVDRAPRSIWDLPIAERMWNDGRRRGEN